MYIGPGLLNITFGSDMPITLLHLMLMSKIYVVNSHMKNVIAVIAQTFFYNLLIHYMGWAYLKHFLKLVVSVNPIEKYKEQLSIKTGSIRIHNGAHLWH